MRRRWARRIALSLLAFLAMMVASALTLYSVEQKRQGEEKYAVYSAYLSEGILNDPHDWSVGPSIEVVILDTTNVNANLRWWWMYPFDGRVRFNELETTTRLSFLVCNLFRSRMQLKIRLPERARPILASNSQITSTDFQKRFPNNLGYVVLSAVGFNRNQTQAVFYIDHFCGLCGGGRYVLMVKLNGSWHVQDEHSTWIS